MLLLRVLFRIDDDCIYTCDCRLAVSTGRSYLQSRPTPTKPASDDHVHNSGSGDVIVRVMTSWSASAAAFHPNSMTTNWLFIVIAR